MLSTTVSRRVMRKNYRMVVQEIPAQREMRLRTLEAAQNIDRPIVMISRHTFEPPLSFSVHQKHDPILQAAYPILGDFAHTSFANWCNPLEIEPLFSDDAVFLHQAMLYGAPACGMCAIGRYGLIAKVRLFMHAWNNQVFVQDSDNIIELGQWLSTLPPASGSVKGERMFHFLQCWWEARGPVFRLMDLPPELWSYVFQLAFGEDIYPAGRDRLGSGHGSSLPHDRQNKQVSAPMRGLLKLNKAIYGELQPFVYKQTRKCFTDLFATKSYIESLQVAPVKYDHLRMMELDLKLRDYIFFFGVEVAPFKDPDCRETIVGSSFWREATVLKHLPSLSDLRVHFPAPSDGINDPWFDLAHLHLRTYDNGRHRDWRGNDRHYHISCQKVLVDWILTFAKEHIDAIPKVSFTGYIKDSTKAKWEQVLKYGKENDDLEQEINMTKMMIRTWDRNDLGPSCHCPTRCGRICHDYFVPKGGKTSVRKQLPFEFDYGDETSPPTSSW